MSAPNYIQLQKQLQLIKTAVSADNYNLGDQFFEEIVLGLNEALQADYTFIGKLNKTSDVVETISVVKQGHSIPNFRYHLKNTPCEVVLNRTPCTYAKNVAKQFPNDHFLKEMGIEAYVGVPLYDSKSVPIGILVCLFNHEIEDSFVAESILMIFASRAGAELEHQKLYAVLEQYQHDLEFKVEERTEELNHKNKELHKSNAELRKQHKVINKKNKAMKTAVEHLKNTQLQLIQAEKMASLGILTAGVTHEINNPLNFILGGYTGLKKHLNGTEHYSSDRINTLLESIETGVDRISEIVNCLSQFSQNNKDKSINIHTVLDNCLVMLNSSMYPTIHIEKRYSNAPIYVNGTMSELHQALLNVLNNAKDSIKNKGTINIRTFTSASKIHVEIIDDGDGGSNNDLPMILDPFFGTKSPDDEIGLGLSIAYSIITEHKGHLSITSEKDKGTKVCITLPIKPLNHEQQNKNTICR